MVSYFSIEERGPSLAPVCFFVSDHAILPENRRVPVHDIGCAPAHSVGCLERTT
jgi:hypothetical protein